MRDKIFKELEDAIAIASSELEAGHKEASIYGSQEDVELTVANYLGRLSRLIAASVVLAPNHSSNSKVVEEAINLCEVLDEDRLSFLCQFYAEDLEQWDFSLIKK